MLRFSNLENITKGKVLQLKNDRTLGALITDSRKMVSDEHALFFAIQGTRHNGHEFIVPLYQAGVRQFVVQQPVPLAELPDANVILVTNVVQALQQLAAAHRQQYSIPVVGITGSNGKTIVKEWLYQLLSPEYSIAKNPGSYNSQIGVPLSVWQIQSSHQLGVFEAGISRPGEMENLQAVIQPTVGIFTMLGTAHAEGFTSEEQKLKEKLKLFKEVNTLIYCCDQKLPAKVIQESGIPSLSWGKLPAADVQISPQLNHHRLTYQGKTFDLELPFTDAASIENCLHGVVLMLYLHYPFEVIQKRVLHLKSIPMRLELKPGINGCQIIDDSYNNDLGGLKISLDFLQAQQRSKKTVIFSDLFQTGLSEEQLLQQLLEIFKGKAISQLIGIGPFLHQHQQAFAHLGIPIFFFPSTDSFLDQFQKFHFQNELILIKGARAYQLERVAQRLQSKVHGTVMEIDLNKIVHNLNYFRAQLKPRVKLMVMVKALAYGSGSEQIANLLQYHRVDYLGVAYADEGADLRKNQITLPIMVMNPSPAGFDVLLSHQLEPVMYNLSMLRQWIDFLQQRPCSIHLEFDTGMHRLGFEESEMKELMELLSAHPNIRVASVFSHLAGADEATHDDFSVTQANRFLAIYEAIVNQLGYRPMRHILNSPGQIRHPQFQWEMVRLGIGLYGINPTEENVSALKPAVALKTIVSQLKTIAAGETIGYGRRGNAQKEMKLATIAIGYADGFSRSFSRGKGKVWINGYMAPVVGNVCMDMTMVDVTGIPVNEGDEVLIFGEALPIQQVAESIETIPYEILTNTSDRVKRVFFAESI